MAIRQPKPRPISLKEFLAMPETEPASELIDGKVVHKPIPKSEHNWPIRQLIRLLDKHEFTREGDRG